MSGRDRWLEAPCDDSGLCRDVSKMVSRSTHVDRCLARGDGWLLLADIAPLTAGHCLFVHTEHIPRSARLTQGLYERRALDVAAIRHRFELAGLDTVIVEHGSGDVRQPGDC